MRIEDLSALAESLRHVPDGRPGWLRLLQDEPSALYYRFLYEVALRVNPKATLETGTRCGRSAAQLAAASPEGKVVTLDIDANAAGWVARSGVPNIVSITADSTSPAAKVAVLSYFKSIDILFLDSDHRYDVVMSEYRTFSPLVRAGGIMLFDDVGLNPDMKRFWSEVPGSKADFDFLHTTYNAGFGVAIKEAGPS